MFHVDLSSLHHLSLNDAISDEDFYKGWLRVVDKQILEFIHYLKRSLVISSELKKGVSDLPKSNKRRILISRNRTNHRKIKNENEIREIFENY